MKRARLVVVLSGLLLAWPALAIPWDEARHLLSRTGFGGTADEIAALRRVSYAEAVDRILAGTRTKPVTRPPAWVHEPPPDFRRLRKMSRAQRKAFRRFWRRRAMQLQSWWIQEMIVTDSPLTEQMTLFWHNHFTSSLRKARWPVLMYRQNLLLRRHALGNFRKMLHAIAEDPAMILYLDNQSNRRGKPNENFARELLELFTLGEGHYTEQDVKEAARAFTGWKVNRRSGRFRFVIRQHDFGDKRFMGMRGHLGGHDVIDRILEHPRVAEFIVEKLWRHFISPTPDSAEVRRLAGIFRRANYEIKPLMRALLLSRAFRDHRNRGVLVKSPVDLLVGSVRVAGIAPTRRDLLARFSRRLGQDLMNPPNVRGWPGGRAWITSSTLILRQRLLLRMWRQTRRRMLDDRMQEAMRMPYASLARLLLPLPPVRAQAGADPARRLRQLLLDPVYQLK